VDPASGLQTPFSFGINLMEPSGIVETLRGDILVVDQSGPAGGQGRVNKITRAGAQSVFSNAGLFSDALGPKGLARGASGSLFVADRGYDNTNNPDGKVLRLNGANGAQAQLAFGGQLVDPTDVVEDPPRCFAQPATIVGSPGKDKLRGTRFGDVIVGLKGKDTIKGRGGKDLICGGPGPDNLVGGGKKDRCNGQGGEDVSKGCEKERRIP